MSARGTLRQAYQESTAAHGYQPDASQLQTIARLDDLRSRLAQAHAQQSGWLGA